MLFYVVSTAALRILLFHVLALCRTRLYCPVLLTQIKSYRDFCCARKSKNKHKREHRGVLPFSHYDQAELLCCSYCHFVEQWVSFSKTEEAPPETSH